MHTPLEVTLLCEILHRAGFEAWIVGGAVRDTLMNREVHDYDIATSAKPEEVLQIFPRVIETGLKHGTVTVCMGEGHYEVTTYRADGEYFDGRRPSEVIFKRHIEWLS